MMSIGGIVLGLFIARALSKLMMEESVLRTILMKKGTTLYALSIVRFDRICLNATGLYKLITPALASCMLNNVTRATRGHGISFISPSNFNSCWPQRLICRSLTQNQVCQ